MASRKALDRLNLRLHINEDHDYEVTTDPFSQHKLLLQKDPAQRNQEEVQMIAEFLEAQMHLRLLCHYLGMTNEHGIDILAKGAQLEQFEFQRTSVWEAGDLASHFYIVLFGKVSVQVPFQDHLALATERVLYPGETFGEIGILNRALRRTAGIRTADNNTSLLSISKELFIRELGPVYLRKYQDRLRVLKQNKAFSSWPESKMKFLAQTIYEKSVHLGDAIACEGDNVENKYFLMLLIRGHVRVDKQIFGETTEIKKKKKKSQYLPTKEDAVKPQTVLEKAPLHLCVLSPGSLIFEPRLVSGTLEHMIEAAKIDRGIHSTTRWSSSYVAKTSVRLWCISRHTYLNIPASAEHLITDLRRFKIKIPSRQVLLASHRQQEKWSKFKARQMIDTYSAMEFKNRQKLMIIAKRNLLLVDREQYVFVANFLCFLLFFFFFSF